MKRIDYFWPRTAFQITGTVFVAQLVALPLIEWTERTAWAIAGSGATFVVAAVWSMWAVYRNAKEASK